MKLEQVALQCYTIRDFCQTEDAFADAMARVAKIGYQAVQISAIGPIDPKRVREICDDHGLTICATHAKPDEIMDEPQKVFDELAAYGCRDTAYPFPSIEHTEANYLNLIERLAAVAPKYTEAGLRLSYHNHALEFVKYSFGTVMDLIFKQAPDLSFELDTYWVQAGGGSPADWCERCTGRLPLLHLKDMVVLDNDTPNMASIGDGNLNWRSIIPRAEAAGCEWFIVEQDTHWYNDDPFTAATRSFDYISNNLVETSTCI